MNKMVLKSLAISIFIGMLLFLTSNYALQVRATKQEMKNASHELFLQMEQILERNDAELEEVKQDFREQCLVRAKAAAYIVENRPSILTNQLEMDRVAQLLEIDEVHVFDTAGLLYAGSEPKYFGFTFDSGEQMQFFLPMLNDKSLELCQDITPNTAEGKLMQYAAVWQEDGRGIVQIGMEPERIISLTKKNDLSYVFSRLTYNENMLQYAVDPENHRIVGCSDEALLGKTIEEIGIRSDRALDCEEGFYDWVNGQLSYCIFHEGNDILLGRSCRIDRFYANVNKNTAFLALYLAAISVIMVVVVSWYLQKNIITSIGRVNQKLAQIAAGNLDERVSVHTTPEFTELSNYTNQMVESLLASTDKLSSALDAVKTQIGTYEYGKSIRGGVRVTRRVPEILGLTRAEASELLADSARFEEKLEKIRKLPLKEMDGVYRLDCKEERYIRMESFQKNQNIFGILLDVTKDVLEKREIQQELDHDLLTGLASRRAFLARMEHILADKEALGCAALVMIDSDYLKYVNDRYGHDCGDRYLCQIAETLKDCGAPFQETARLSGDEFAVLFYRCKSREQLRVYIDRLDAGRIKAKLPDEGAFLETQVSYSMGTAFYGEDGMDYATLMKCADQRMYEDKRSRKAGRDSVREG